MLTPAFKVRAKPGTVGSCVPIDESFSGLSFKEFLASPETRSIKHVGSRFSMFSSFSGLSFKEYLASPETRSMKHAGSRLVLQLSLGTLSPRVAYLEVSVWFSAGARDKVKGLLSFLVRGHGVDAPVVLS
jgi:hypothetical protein